MKKLFIFINCFIFTLIENAKLYKLDPYEYLRCIFDQAPYCQSEKDFEKFRKKHGYNFVLNRTDINEDKEVGPLNYSDDTWQKPYYFYNNRHANGGGLTMRYSVPEKKLYGRYSNR